MKKFAVLFAIVFCLGINLPSLQADSVTHQWLGTGVNGDNFIDVDNQGGSFDNGNADNTYHFIVDGVSHTSTLTLLLFDGVSVDDGADDDDASGSSMTGEDFGMGSMLQILAPPSILNPPISQIAAQSDNPLTPISFVGLNTGLDVQLLTYIQEGSDFAVYEYVVTNNTAMAVPVKIGLGGDFDVNESSGSDNNGKDLSLPVVFEYDSTDSENPGFFYAAGIALARGQLDQYRLGACCDITFEDGGNGFPTILDAQRLAYFNARPNEECDDGNTANGDGCSADCLNETGAEVCGNGVTEAGESCDDGNTNNSDGCSDTCRLENCGDGILDPGEECDDDDVVDGDDCSSFCTVEFNDSDHYCGNGVVDNGGVGDQILTEQDVEVTISADLETLNPGDSRAAAFCVVGGISTTSGVNAGQVAVLNAQDCITLYQDTIGICGNGVQNAGEECDDGNTIDNDGCDGNCTTPGCGNAVLNADEACDDGNLIDGDGCDSLCNLESSCGDGIIDLGESCDDGNTVSGDGCSSACILEAVGPGATFGGSGCALQPAAPLQIGHWLYLTGVLFLLGLYRFRHSH